jgi:tripartite-type tricarboxylate transporter receptor subunit TctC
MNSGVSFMRQGHSYDVIARSGSPARRPGGSRLGIGLAVAALVLTACGGDGGGGGGGGGGEAEGYPDGDITFVVPFSAGGPTDTVTRLIAEPMSEELGASIVVQNVEGAGGTVAAGEVANANPDGYTVLMHHIGMSTAPSLYPDLAYDPLEDFKTIGLVTEVPMTIVARKDFEPATMEEFVDYVKENADQVTLANAGIGAASHLCGLLLQEAIGAKLTEVPYDGTGPALTDLVGGQVDIMCDQTTNTTGQIQGGEIKAYAVTTPERVESLPDLPTTEESGLADLQVGVWHGLYVPVETPDEIVQKLTDALKVALADQNVIDELAKLGSTPSSEDDATPEAHTERLEEQIELWRPIIEEAGVAAN